MNKLLIVLAAFLYTSAFCKLIPTSFRVEFEQTHKSVIKKRKKTTKLKLDYRYPSQIILRTGDDTVYTSNGKKTWFYRAPFIKTEKGEVIIQKRANLGLLDFFDSLSKGIDTYKKTLYNYTLNNKTLSFKFTQKGIEKLGLSQIKFFLKNNKKIKNLTFKDISKIEKKEPGRKPVELVVKALEVEKKFSPRHFYFQIPDNTKIVKR